MPHKDPEKRKECQKLYRQSHRQELTEYNRRYYQENKERMSLRSKRHYQENRDGIIKRVKNYTKQNWPKVRAYHIKYLTIPEKRAKHNEWIRKRSIRERLQCIDHYSQGTMSCKCCGESLYEFLTIDHINGGGNKHKKATNNHVYHWLVVNDFPDGYRVLCYNCNCSLGLYGRCPHDAGR